MKKDCEYYMEEYLALDKGQHVPFKLAFHLLFCKSCRKQVRALSWAEKLAARPLKISVPLNDRTLLDIMAQIDPSYKPKKYSVSMVLWALSGLVMIATMCLLSGFAPTEFSHLLQFVCYLTFAGVIIAHCALFISTNLDFFIKKINTRRTMARPA